MNKTKPQKSRTEKERSEAINPFTAMLAAPSLGKRPHIHKKKRAKFETIKAFLPPSHEHMKGFLSKCTILKVDVL